MKELWKPIAALAVTAALVAGARFGLAGTAAANAEAELDGMMATILPGSATFAPEEYHGEDENIVSVHKGETGYVVETVTAGYAGDVRLLVGVDSEGAVTGVVVREMTETHGLGQTALEEVAFLEQFLGSKGDANLGDGVDALTGATVTSKAIAKGVNSAAAFVTGADVGSGATEWGG